MGLSGLELCEFQRGNAKCANPIKPSFAAYRRRRQPVWAFGNTQFTPDSLNSPTRRSNRQPGGRGGRADAPRQRRRDQVGLPRANRCIAGRFRLTPDSPSLARRPLIKYAIRLARAERRKSTNPEVAFRHGATPRVATRPQTEASHEGSSSKTTQPKQHKGCCAIWLAGWRTKPSLQKWWHIRALR
jgi:hypothetical protein